MLLVSDLACSRGERRLFSDLSFELPAGGWVHVTGENGAGKTTLLRTLVGLSPADCGEIRWRGAPLRECRDTYHGELMYLGHHSAVKDELTPLENVEWSAALDGVHVNDEDALRALHKLGLRGREQVPARYLSAGQRRRVLLSRLLLRRAALWVLDEPFTALDTAAVALLGELIKAHVEQGGAAILTSHQTVPIAGGKVVSI